MVLPPEVIVIERPLPYKEVTGYQTSDGVVHGTINEALKYSRDKVIREYFNWIEDEPTKFGVSRAMTDNLAEEEFAVTSHFEAILKIMVDKGLVS